MGYVIHSIYDERLNENTLFSKFTRVSFFRSLILQACFFLQFIIYKFSLSGCLFVCLYSINVKTAEPIGPKFFVGSRVTLGKVFEWSNFQKFASIKIRFLKNFENPQKFFLKIRDIFCFYYLLTRRSPVYFIFTNEIKYRREAP